MPVTPFTKDEQPTMDNFNSRFEEIFSKDDTMTAETAALYALEPGAMPNDILSKLKPMVDTAQNRADDTYTKTQTLKSATSALYGLGAAAVPDDVFSKNANGLKKAKNVWTFIKEYRTAGAYTFTVPAGVTKIGVYMVGGGGGGGASIVIYSSDYVSMSSGGASGYGKNVIFNVTPGQVISIVVGAGGERTEITETSRKGNYGKNGGATSFNGVTADGGRGGGDYNVSTDTSVSPAIGGQASGGGYSGEFPSSPIRYGNSAVLYGSSLLFPQTPREGQNAFDQTMVTLCAGAGSYHSAHQRKMK